MRRHAMSSDSLRAVLLGSTASLALAASPVLADQAEDLKAQIDSLQQRLDQLEKRNAVDGAQTAAPADAVLAGDYPGSFKLPGSDTSYSIHGYTKLDFIYDFDQLLSETFDVSAITSGTSASKRGGGFIITARESRINFQTRTPTDYGQLKTFIEGDFYGSNGAQINGNSSHGFRLRHAYGALGPFMAGQYWSNTIDIDDYPELLDFGAGVGRPFVRQPQVIFTQNFGHFTFHAALENPADITRPAPGGAAELGPTIGTVTPGGSVSTRPSMPDISGHLEYMDSWGHLHASGVIRRFEVDNGITAPTAASPRLTDSAIGYGGVLGGAINLSAFGVGGSFARDNFGWQAYAGSGFGHYILAPEGGVGLGTFAEFNATGTALKVITTAAYGGAVNYQHFWTDQFRSTVSYGIAQYKIPSSVAFSTTQSQRIQTAYANLIWSPLKSVNIGIEFMWGERLQPRNPVTGSTADGTAKRLQASLQCVF